MYAVIPVKLGKLVKCTIVNRLSRFTVLSEVNGRKEVVYINNTGRLRDYIKPGNTGYCVENKRGKLRYRLVGVSDGEYAALVDTHLQERSFLALQALGLIPWLDHCTLYKRNYRLGSAIVDFAFICDDEVVVVELKSAVLKLEDSSAGYPDAPTERGRKQVLELAHYACSGGQAIVVFIAAVPYAKRFKLYCYEDKHIKQAVEKAVQCGVTFKALNIFLDPSKPAIVLGDLDIPVDLSCDSADLKV